MTKKTHLPIGLTYRDWEIVGKYERCGGSYLELKCLRCSLVRSTQSYRLTRAMKTEGTLLCENCDAKQYEETSARGRLGRRKAPNLTEWQRACVIASLRSRKWEEDGHRLYRPDEVQEMVRETQDMCRTWDDAQCRQYICDLKPRFRMELRHDFAHHYGQRGFEVGEAPRRKQVVVSNRPQRHRVTGGK